MIVAHGFETAIYSFNIIKSYIELRETFSMYLIVNLYNYTLFKFCYQFNTVQLLRPYNFQIIICRL